MGSCEATRNQWSVSGTHQRCPGRRSFDGKRNRGVICTKAQTLDRRLLSGSGQREQTRERILRYPNGQERRIRYPTPPSDEDYAVISTSSDTSYRDWWGTEVYYEIGNQTDTSALTSGRFASTSGRTHKQERRPETAKPQQTEALPDGLPSSPAELLRYISSEPYKEAQAEQQRLVHGSYKILDGSPWVRTRPVYVLASEQQGSEAGLTYTMRTRVTRADAEDEVSKVLGRRRPDGSSLIKVEELRDGIVTFEDEADAQRFAEQLEAEGVHEVMVAGCDAHELFRQARSVRAVVVLLPAEGHLPQPEQLNSALRGQRSLEELS